MARSGYVTHMPFAVHRTVEFASGLVLAIAPFLLAVTDLVDARAAATLIAAALGIALITLGVASTREGTALDPKGHSGLDYVLIALLLIAGVGLALGGEGAIGTLCVAIGIVQVAITFGTRYETERPDVTSGTTSSTD